MAKNSQRGSAVLEAAPVMILIVLFVGGILLAAYLLFARAWIQYQSEQALYCAAESRTDLQCKYKLEEKLKQLLPWGDSTVAIHAANDKWRVEVQWKYKGYAFHLVKELTPKDILKAKALQW